MKILLLNPPAERLILRDYFCGTTSKGGYYWPPIDLLVQSGWLSELGEIALLEAPANRIPPAKAMARIIEQAPDIIVSLVGTPSLKQDMAFLYEAKRATGARLAVMGEPAMGWDETDWSQYDHVDAVLGDFTAPDLKLWLSGAPHSDALVTHGQCHPRVMHKGNLSFPQPRHELFLHQPYRHPFLGRGRLGTLLMAYGCPYRCAYCNSGAHSLGFAVRTVDDIMAECQSLRDAGAKRIYMKDMTFGANRALTEQLLQAWIDQDEHWPWAAYIRPDAVDDALLTLMRRAGCVGIQVGLEAKDVADLEFANRNQNETRTERSLRIADKLGMKIGGHFVLGMPGQSRQNIQDTLTWAKSLPLTYASFNVYVPRHNTSPHETDADHLRHLVRDSSKGGTAQDLDLVKLQRQANLSFYGRPRAIVRAAGMWMRQAGLLN